MKISPKGPPVPPSAPDPVAKDKAAGPSSFDKVLAGDNKPTEPQAIDPSGMVAELAAKIEAGQISSGDAAKQLIDRIVETRAANLPEALQNKLRQALQQTIENDPWLAGQLGRQDG